MSPKSFAILALATAASVGLAVSAIAGRDLPVQATAVNQAMFPGLLDHLNEIGRIQITSPAGKLTVQAGDKGWSLVEKSGYPVPADQVRKLALAIANLQLVEARTADPDRLKRLELEEPAGQGFKSRLVELTGKDGKPLAAVVVGKASPGLYGGGRGGSYVRRAGENQAWLAAGDLEVPGDALALVGRDMIDVPSADVARVILDPDGARPVALSRPDPKATEFTTDASLPEGRKLDPVKVEELIGSLGGLSMEDVRPAAEVAMPPDARRSRFVTFDGLTVDVAVATLGQGETAERWATFAVTAPPASAPQADTPAKPPTKRAEELTARLQGWAFRLPPYLADHLTGGFDQLRADPEPAS
jgi:hypothetical protein